MTRITRSFNPQTRSLLNVQQRYAGQQFDSEATTLEIVDTQVYLDFLGWNPSTGKFGNVTPYILFNVPDKDGNLMVYGPDSSPKFDGFTFPIPWDVTSRLERSSRIEYQLFFVKLNVDYDGTYPGYLNLKSTDYILSAVDGIVLKPSLKPHHPCGCNPPMTSQTQPTITGWIELWKRFGLIQPVEQFQDETGRTVVRFHNYQGETYDVLISSPTLDDTNHIPAGYLPIVKDWHAEPHDTCIPSEKLVYDTIQEGRKTPFQPWNRSTTYHRFSCVLVGGNRLYVSKQDDNKGNEPEDGESAWWVPVSGGDTPVDPEKIPWGRPAKTVCIEPMMWYQDEEEWRTIFHGMGTKNFFTLVRTMDESNRYVYCTSRPVDENSCMVLIPKEYKTKI